MCRLQSGVERCADCSLVWRGVQTAVWCGEVCRLQSPEVENKNVRNVNKIIMIIIL
jgi:hypothetical protein